VAINYADTSQAGIQSDINALFGGNAGASSQDPNVIKFLLDELDAQHAGSGYADVGYGPQAGTLDNFTFTSVKSIHDFMSVVGYAEQFAAATGWKYFPPAALLRDIATFAPTAQQAWSVMFDRMPQAAQQAHPGALFGMDSNTYLQSQSRYQDMLEQYTGNRDVDPAILRQALAENWSTTHFTSWMQKDPGVLSKAGWVKYGYDFTSWTNYKQQNKQAITNRYGAASATGSFADTYYLQNLANPLTRFDTQSAQVRYGQQGSQQPSGQSEVR
jgi:hypothetical protein